MLVNTTGDITLASVPVSRGGKVAEARVASKSKPGTHAGNSGGVVLLVYVIHSGCRSWTRACLLDGYDRNARPLHDPSRPINVTMDLTFNQIIDLVIL